MMQEWPLVMVETVTEGSFLFGEKIVLVFLYGYTLTGCLITKFIWKSSAF